MQRSTAILVFPGGPNHRDTVSSVLSIVNLELTGVAGFVDSQVTSLDSESLDWAISVTFRSSATLRERMASPRRAATVEALRNSEIELDVAEIVVGSDISPPPGVAVFTHKVSEKSVADFVELMSVRIAQSKTDTPGFLGTCIIPAKGGNNVWLSITRFDSQEHLDAWLGSAERAEILPQLRSLLDEEFDTITNRSPFGAIVRIVGGQPLTSPRWKMVLLVVSALFPTVVVLTRFLGIALEPLGLQSGIQMLIGNLVGTVILTFLLMPYFSRAFAWWIDPVAGQGLKTSTLGALAVTFIYAAEVAFFWVFPVLTPWAS